MACFCLAILALASYGAHAARSATSGLVAAYSFDEGTGTAVRDSSGNGNNGTISNATWSTSGRYGGALSFNGSSSLVTVPDSSSLDLTSAATLEAWVKPAASMSTAWKSIVLKEQSGELVYALYANSSKSTPAGIVYSGGEKTAWGSGQLPASVWSHLAATYDGSAVRYYLNGSLVSTVAASGSIAVSSGALRIGGNTVWGEYFNGLIDDVRVYNRALSQSEIQSDMSTPVGSAPAAPTAMGVAGVTPSAISLSWSEGSSVAGFDVYVNGTKLGTVSGASYTFTGLACASAYTLGVDAYDTLGRRSPVTSTIAATGACPDATPPSAPANLVVTNRTQTSLTLSWSASSDNVGVAGYDVYRNGAKYSATSSTSYTYAGLACGATYTLAVDAYDAAGNVSPTSSVAAATASCADATPPSTPSGLAVVSSTASSLAVSWSPSSDNVGVAGYDVYLNGARAGTTSSTSYTYSGLACGGTYTYAVDAYDAAGNVSTAASATGATAACSSGAGATYNAFVAPNGSDSGANCKWFATPTSNPDPSGGTVCASFNKAYQLAGSRPGTVLVMPGTYASQTLAQNAANDSVGVGNRVSFVNPASQTAVTVNGISADGARHLEFHNMDIAGGVDCSFPGSLTTTSHVSLDVQFWDSHMHGTSAGMFVSGCSNFEWHGGEIGPTGNALGGGSSPVLQFKMAVTCSTNPCTTVSDQHGLVIDGAYIHDITKDNTADHQQCLFIDSSPDITITNNVFYHCWGNQSILLTYTTIGGGGSVTTAQKAYPTGLIANNYFGEGCDNACPGGGQQLSWSEGGNVQGPLKIAYNSGQGSFSTENNAAAMNGGSITMVGNIYTSGNCTPSTTTYSHNVRLSGNGACGATDVRTSLTPSQVYTAPSNARPDMSLRAGTPPVDAGDAGDHPATDIQGTSRPCGGSDPDAGAFESCSG